MSVRIVLDLDVVRLDCADYIYGELPAPPARCIYSIKSDNTMYVSTHMELVCTILSAMHRILHSTRTCPGSASVAFPSILPSHLSSLCWTGRDAEVSIQ